MAATLCSIGLMAMKSSFDGSRTLVSEAERNEVAAHRAQRALEQALAVDYDDLGLQGTTTPPRSTDPNHPSNRITTSGTYQYNGTQAAPFVMGGTLAHSETWNDPANRLSGTVYRYVTEYRDPSLSEIHGKRVTIAVTVRDRRKAVVTTTVVRDEG